MSFEVSVDVTNPGQYFACCGLFELAHRLTGGGRARFAEGTFHVDADVTLPALVDALVSTKLVQVDPADDTGSAIDVGAPFVALRLDWWHQAHGGVRDLKVWAGTMESVRIARSMQGAMRAPQFADRGLLDVGVVAYDPDAPTKKVEPFYFDARRAPNSHSRDVGFSPNDLGLETTASPAVELLCLIGLHRFRPRPTKERRIFDYFAWGASVPISVAPALASGGVPTPGSHGYRFESWFRTGQRKHKAFRAATALSRGEAQ
jgi:CRISPR-associated protein Csb3